MDKEVLIRFIEMIQSVLSRVNSKRLMTLYAFYYFLYAIREIMGADWLGGLAGVTTLIVLYSFYVEKKDTL
jgi:hypothetical protein